MVGDTEAREAVRQLLRRFELIAAQGLAMAYVLAEKDKKEYARLLEAAETIMPTVIQPIIDSDLQRGQVYAALDDPKADWCKAVHAMLNQGPIILRNS